MNEEFFFSGSNDGTIAIWNINKKKPITFVRDAHRTSENTEQSAEAQNGHDQAHERYEPSGWITAVAAFQNSDLLASGNHIF
jgi:ribosomal RNA-processing protein 9